MPDLLLNFCLGVIFLLLSTRAFVKLAKNISLVFRHCSFIYLFTLKLTS